MLGRSDIFRAAAIVALVAVFIATLVAVDRRPSAPVVETFLTGQLARRQRVAVPPD